MEPIRPPIGVHQDASGDFKDQPFGPPVRDIARICHQRRLSANRRHVEVMEQRAADRYLSVAMLVLIPVLIVVFIIL